MKLERLVYQYRRQTNSRNMLDPKKYTRIYVRKPLARKMNHLRKAYKLRYMHEFLTLAVSALECEKAIEASDNR